MKRVIITGANGFLGRNLVNHITDFDVDHVRLLDIHPTDTDPISTLSYDQFVVDLANDSLAQHIDSEDVVIHLAWRSNPAVTGSDVDAEMALNWNASKNVIALCASKNAKLIFISSGGTVYGTPSYLPIDESHPTKPISAYGQVKLKVEDAIREASEKKGLRYVILRPSNLYGPGFSLKKGLGVIGHWVEMIKTNKAIQMVGEGELVRDFIHIDDLCKGILSCLRLENETLNMGAGKGTSLNELSSIFEKLIKRPLEIDHLESRGFDVKTNVLSIKKIQQLADWSPSISLEQGISQLLEAD
ncbi:MAG: NAD-dependent epimerase/dehydratase family protein [Ekhidna sp.]